MLVAALVGAALSVGLGRGAGGRHGAGGCVWGVAGFMGGGLQAAASGLQRSLCSELRPAWMAFLH